ncbi:MAG: hypothetical protein WDO14_05110 [Bacteroidota bacterium]
MPYYSFSIRRKNALPDDEAEVYTSTSKEIPNLRGYNVVSGPHKIIGDKAILEAVKSIDKKRSENSEALRTKVLANLEKWVKKNIK